MNQLPPSLSFFAKATKEPATTDKAMDKSEGMQNRLLDDQFDVAQSKYSG